MTYLDFEKEIEQLDKNLDALKNPYESEGISSINQDKITDLQSTIDRKIIEIYSNLNSWQKTKVARHEKRPRSDYYIKNIFKNFQLISGDRYYAEDESVITGFAKLDNMSVLVIGQEKGYDTESRIKRNFGMARPEGYRKAARLMKLADKFGLPIITFIDTPGAYPGKGAEERGQAEAIARSTQTCLEVSVPIISIIIGEGGSGGAIAMASANTLIMLEHSIYSVISPEGCASILWKNSDKMREAADALQLTAQHLKKIGVVDKVIKEPLGGAHRDKKKALEEVKKSLLEEIIAFQKIDRQKIKKQRSDKYINMGSLSNL